MSDFDRNVAARGSLADRAVAVDAGLRAHMIRVYNYMAAAVALTGVVAWFTFNAAVTATRRSLPTPFGQTLFGGPMMIVLMLATLGLVFFISFRIQQLQFSDRADAVHGLRGAARRHAGVDLPRLHRRLDHARVLHLGGLVRRAEPVGLHHAARSLSGMGSFLIMGLFGIIIASLVNLFLKSSGLDWAISVIGVGVFAGLTAYDTQRIKEMYDVNDDGTVSGRKAVMGALSLYLDFINLFLMLLRLVGDRR